MSVRKWPVVGVVLAVLWLFVRGVEPGGVAAGFVVGMAVGLPVAYAVRRLYTPRTALWRNLRVAPYGALYVLAFVQVLVRANLDVAYRVLAPSMPIEPAVVELPLRVRTDAAVTTIANSITLTPGTLTLDHDGERNSLYVHAIAGRDPAAVAAPIRRWEDYALVIFDEDLKPGDPAPPPRLGSATGPRPDGRGSEDDRREGGGRRSDGNADDLDGDGGDEPDAAGSADGAGRNGPDDDGSADGAGREEPDDGSANGDGDEPDEDGPGGPGTGGGSRGG